MRRHRSGLSREEKTVALRLLVRTHARVVSWTCAMGVVDPTFTASALSWLVIVLIYQMITCLFSASLLSFFYTS